MILPQLEDRVMPNTQAAPNFQTGDPMAQAGEQLGKTIEGVGGQMQEFAHQEKVKADQTVTRDSYVNFSKEIIDLESDGLRKKGKDAFDVNTYGQKFSEIKDKYRSQLKNKDQVFMFDNQTKMEELRFTTSLHRHAAIEADELNKNNAKAQTEMDEQKLSLGYQDPANYDEKNPLSPISKFLVSVDEQAKINGLSEKDPEYQEEMFNAKSKAFTDRAKLMMTDNPSEALKFVTEHKSEIATKDYENLEKSLKHESEEMAGMEIARSYHKDIKSGKKLTDITDEIEEKTKDRPGVGKVATAELKAYESQWREDETNEASGWGIKIEAEINKMRAKGQVPSLDKIKSMSELTQLTKAAAGGNEIAAKTLNQLKSYASKKETQQKREIKADAAEARREQSDYRKQFQLDTSDPNTLKLMSKADLYAKSMKAKLTIGQYKELESAREKAIKDSNSPKNMHNTHIQTTLLPAILEKANIPENEQEDFGKAWAGAVKAKEDELQRPLTDDEIKDAGLMGIQNHATNSWNPFKAKHEWTNESKTPQAAKTVKLPDGKQYKDGDIYTDPKTGKKSRVKVNG